MKEYTDLFFDFFSSHSTAIYCLVSVLVGLVAGRISGWSSKNSRHKTRKNAIEKSRSVINGQVSEQIAAFLPDFPCDPADVRFVGKPVDFVGFVGAGKDEEISEILLIEVKTGTSQLSTRERQIKNCVKKGKVRYVEYRIEN